VNDLLVQRAIAQRLMNRYSSVSFRSEDAVDGDLMVASAE
jgi:hypothetical protein